MSVCSWFQDKKKEKVRGDGKWKQREIFWARKIKENCNFQSSGARLSSYIRAEKRQGESYLFPVSGFPTSISPFSLSLSSCSSSSICIRPFKRLSVACSIQIGNNSRYLAPQILAPLIKTNVIVTVQKNWAAVHKSSDKTGKGERRYCVRDPTCRHTPAASQYSH